MRRVACALVLALLGGWLAGCQPISETVQGQLETLSQPSQRAVEIETAATTVAASTPTTIATPLATPTLRGRQITEATGMPAGAELPPTLAPESAEDLRQQCTLLWDLMQAGDQLVQEWHAWYAEDPSSPQAHQARLEEFVRRWEAHAQRAAGTAVAAPFAPIKEAYLDAVRTYWGSALLALETLSRGDQRTGPQAEELMAKADQLWYLAYDQIDALCYQAYAEGVPLPTVPAKPPQPTPTLP